MALKAVAVGVVAVGLLGTSPAEAGTMQQVQAFGSNPGALKMYLYSPTNMPTNAPVVVAMHGCTQKATNYVDAGWNDLADELKFYVVYPEQTSSNNPAGCFNWAGEYGDTDNMIRGRGENQSIKSMVDYVLDRHDANADRVYATGFSAGGAMAAVMLATWPDVFTAGAVGSGVAYWCADTVNSAYSCMFSGKNKTPEQWGDLVRDRGFPQGYDGPLPRVAIFHGSSDTTVTFSNMQELMEQWTNVNGIDAVADDTEAINTPKGVHTHKTYTDRDGVSLVETWEIAGMGHGMAVDPGLSEAGGCGRVGSYTYDEDLCAVYLTAQFFGLDNADADPPEVALTSPADGDVVTGVVQVSAQASDDVGIDRVIFTVDGAQRAEDANPPYTFSWNTGDEVNGDHRLVAQAIDVSGNAAEDAITVTVEGGLVDTEAPTVSFVQPNQGDTVSGLVSLLASADDDFGVVEVVFYADGDEIGSAFSAPWAVEWDTGALDDGPYSLEVEAFDAAGNSDADGPIEVIVDNTVSEFSETFSSRGADNAGWSMGGWRLNRDNNSGRRSFSMAAEAAASFGTTTQTASITVRLGPAPTLSYHRKLDIYVANTTASAAFRVLVDGQVVDRHLEDGFGSYAEATWRERDGIDLASFAGREVTLSFEVEATDSASIITTASAWIDDITLTQQR